MSHKGEVTHLNNLYSFLPVFAHILASIPDIVIHAMVCSFQSVMGHNAAWLQGGEVNVNVDSAIILSKFAPNLQSTTGPVSLEFYTNL
jgi:hypothetical protein